MELTSSIFIPRVQVRRSFPRLIYLNQNWIRLCPFSRNWLVKGFECFALPPSLFPFPTKEDLQTDLSWSPISNFKVLLVFMIHHAWKPSELCRNVIKPVSLSIC